MAKYSYKYTSAGRPRITTGFQNQRISIYTNAATANTYGGTDPNNTVYWETSAEVWQLRSSRTLEGAQALLPMMFTFKVRYRDDKNIQNDMLLYWRGSWFTIQGYMPDVVYREYVVFDGKQMNLGNMVTT